jgi:hypothetical protein
MILSLRPVGERRDSLRPRDHYPFPYRNLTPFAAVKTVPELFPQPRSPNRSDRGEQTGGRIRPHGGDVDQKLLMGRLDPLRHRTGLSPT